MGRAGVCEDSLWMGGAGGRGDPLWMGGAEGCWNVVQFLLQDPLSVPLQLTYVVHGQPHPLVLPRPRLLVGPQHDAVEGVVNEPLNFGLQSPVPELNLLYRK